MARSHEQVARYHGYGGLPRYVSLSLHDGTIIMLSAVLFGRIESLDMLSEYCR